MTKDLPGTVYHLTKDLYFSLVDESFKPSASSSKYVYFSTDNTLVYTAFFADFGPLNLGLVCTFCQQLQEVISSASAMGKAVVYHAASPQAWSNSAVLVCAYQIFVLGYSAEKAYAPFMGAEAFIPFRDAAFCLNTWPLFVLDCVRAMGKAVALGHFNYKSFDPVAFKKLAQLENGDLSWIVPKKFIAFSGPLSKRRNLAPGVFSLLPEEYVPIFKQLGVTCIVRFNNKCYDKTVFERGGIRHVDLFYEDGGNPTEAILQSFLKLCENETGAIAVHCKAGLGRTGTNIVAYMIKHYGYAVREATAWHRLCRPGAVVGPQQQFLQSIEQKLQQEGEQFRARLHAAETAAGSSRGNSARGGLHSRSGRASNDGASGGHSPAVMLPRADSFPPRHQQPLQVGTGVGLSPTDGYTSGPGSPTSRVGTAGGASSSRGSSSSRALFSGPSLSQLSPSAQGGAGVQAPAPVTVAAMGVRTDRETARREREERQRERAYASRGL